jgi:hypothetical protein
MPEHILFLTGRLAERSLHRVLESMQPAAFTYTVHALGLQVAGLMTSDMIRRRLTDVMGANRIIVPGRCRGDLDEVSAALHVPVIRGPDELKDLPRTELRLEHFCVEGWSAVAVRTGVLLRELARRADVSPDARYVDFDSFDDGYHESWDIESAMHPQTLVVYAKDGAALTPAYGAPARLHSPVKLGYKNTKYLTKIMFMPERNGGYWSDRGYEWYGGV